MWWLLISYWITSYVIYVAPFLMCPEYSAAWQGLKSKAKSRRHLAFGVIIYLVALVIIAPLILPFSLVSNLLFGHRRLRYIRGLLRSHQEHLFDPVHPVNLPREVRRQFDDHSSALEELGFQLIGNYRMKPEPPDYYGRLLQSDDGLMVCGVIHMFDVVRFSFTTLFEGGQAMETTSNAAAKGQEWLAEGDRMRAVFGDDRPIAECLNLHVAAVADFAGELSAPPLRFAPDRVLEILVYEHRLFGQVQYERGNKDAPPPEPVLPECLPLLAGSVLAITSV